MPLPSWQIIDDGFQSGINNMLTDKMSLEAMQSGELEKPQVRFFGWAEKTISYGYLVQKEAVQRWAKTNFPNQNIPMVQRPTAGGVVCHESSDLSVSFLWPKGQGLFPEKPRDCYEAIHEILKTSLTQILTKIDFDLYSKPTGTCEAPSQSNFSVCYQKPVCNDVMRGDRKIIGGALRLTKKAILYQGNIVKLEGLETAELIKKISALLTVKNSPPCFTTCLAGRRVGG